jgi:hypothetical protein
MDPAYQESRMVLPKNLTIILALVLIATWAFMLVYGFIFNPDMPMTWTYIVGVVFLIIIALTFLMRFSTSIYDDRIELFYIAKKTIIMKDDIIDTKCGELNIIKSYTPWSLKGTRYKTYSAIGEELGVGVKLKGKMVYYFSTTDPDAIMALLPNKEE